MSALRRVLMLRKVLCDPRCSSNKPQRYFQTSLCNMDANTSTYEVLQSTFSESGAGAMIAEKKCKWFCHYYSALVFEEKINLLRMLSQQFGVNQDNVINVAHHVITSQEKGDATLLMAEERLRNALTPKYRELFHQIGRIEGGVKFLVDLRADILSHLSGASVDKEIPYFRSLNSMLQELLVLWFSVGFLNLERVTWESACDVVQKISEYEAVHPIRNWADLKQRVGPYRRCFVFTHNSMPREPVVVLHTALASQISDSIHSIVFRTYQRSSSVAGSEDGKHSSSTDTDRDLEEPSLINAAVFYSITSTQRGLQGVDLGNYLIKRVVRELQAEFPHLNQFSSLSPIPGFKDWLITEINKYLHETNIGEFPQNVLFTAEELSHLSAYAERGNEPPMACVKHILQAGTWVEKEPLCSHLKTPLMRLCARYLYVEKRRGRALNPVANFHLGNGAVMWRLNWLGDTSSRGITQSCGMMVNYRYYLEQTEENSRKYLENHEITASEQVVELCTDVAAVYPVSS
ncbi:malonyl-CoA decarboxylase, mitochondrial-like [Liolophura sinensis]|uniref:malonyl-CoA decarboxylase, mitochondrial-like n=1 Tax=Liolophura sinensis TaxID=3198878 RepID=UPI0031584FC5